MNLTMTIIFWSLLFFSSILLAQEDAVILLKSDVSGKGWVVLRFAGQSKEGITGIIFPGTNRAPNVDFILNNGTLLKTITDYSLAINEVRRMGGVLTLCDQDFFLSMHYNENLFTFFDQNVVKEIYQTKGATPP